MKKWDLKMLVEAAMMLALAFILSKIKVYRAPNGGSVTAGSMIPIILFSLRWGAGPGVLVGVVFGFIKLFFGGWVLNIPQAILEYPVAYGLLGLSGLFSGKNTDLKDLKTGKIVAGSFIAILGRFICHLLAGVIFFKDTLPAGNPWIASGLYQVSYLVPEFIITAVILSLIWKPMSRISR